MGSLGVFPTTSVILLGISPCIWGVSIWEALYVVSQKWSFPTTQFYMLAYYGLVVEIQPLNCFCWFCSPSNVNQEFFPGIRIFPENHQNPRGNSDRFFQRRMVEKNGKSTPRLLDSFTQCVLPAFRHFNQSGETHHIKVALLKGY